MTGRWIHRTAHLRHQPISPGPFLVLENDVLVVVGHQVLEPRIVPTDPALRQSARPQRVLRHVGHVLLEHEGFQFPRGPPPDRAPTGTAALDHPRKKEEDQRENAPPPHLLRSPALRVAVVIPLARSVVSPPEVVLMDGARRLTCGVAPLRGPTGHLRASIGRWAGPGTYLYSTPDLLFYLLGTVRRWAFWFFAKRAAAAALLMYVTDGTRMVLDWAFRVMFVCLCARR